MRGYLKNDSFKFVHGGTKKQNRITISDIYAFNFYYNLIMGQRQSKAVSHIKQ